MAEALRNNWLEYLSEAIGLGVFMFSACVFSVLLFHPGATASVWSAQTRQAMMGLAMGTTAVAIFKSPFGKRSGAHINPAVTLTFWRLGKIRGIDAVFYVLFQFIGSAAGVGLAHLLLQDSLSAVNYAVTIPDISGAGVSFAAEFAISIGMMTAVLVASNHSALSRLTPFVAGTLVAVYIAVESPISGMSMNPARTFGSAVFGGIWTDWWVYFTAPPLAMLSAAELYVRTRGPRAVLCAKLDHARGFRCIFDCRQNELKESQ